MYFCFGKAEFLVAITPVFSQNYLFTTMNHHLSFQRMYHVSISQLCQFLLLLTFEHLNEFNTEWFRNPSNLVLINW